ncbi:hypothetical protein GALMADRAFT_148230 [Galerina marginata CBS 339.88]|uniref:Uncharacterized protein n=1 Tax=Galerina marginata (strain CBS 339.88) TaxID=685588 RepID=A0A067SE17_GALM3|nr:hypothetical protein GALMADRAFT_148230 [Galerina marginata CBS 339.88]
MTANVRQTPSEVDGDDESSPTLTPATRYNLFEQQEQAKTRRNAQHQLKEQGLQKTRPKRYAAAVNLALNAQTLLPDSVHCPCAGTPAVPISDHQHPPPICAHPFRKRDQVPDPTAAFSSPTPPLGPPGATYHRHVNAYHHFVAHAMSNKRTNAATP